jgi:hypothetical protein
MDSVYEYVELTLFATAGLSFLAAYLMHEFDFGNSRVLSPILGFGAGALVFLISTNPFLCLVLGIISTIVINLLLTYIVYAKAEDKYGERVYNKLDEIEARMDKKSEAHKSGDFDKILFAETVEERVKYLNRHMESKKFYRFNFSANPAEVFDNVKEALDNSNLTDTCPDVKMRAYTEEKDGGEMLRQIIFSVPRVQLAFINAFDEARKEYFVLGIYKYNKDGLRIREMVDLDAKTGHLLDKIYTTSNNAISALDSGLKMEIITFYLT